jgi:hypothetical protein
MTVSKTVPIIHTSFCCNSHHLALSAVLVNTTSALPNLNIDEMYADLCRLEEDSITGKGVIDGGSGMREQEMMREDFWREMENSEDPFQTICFFISKGYLANI